jgi:hypothetical protein
MLELTAAFCEGFRLPSDAADMRSKRYLIDILLPRHYLDYRPKTSKLEPGHFFTQTAPIKGIWTPQTRAILALFPSDAHVIEANQ